MKLSLLQTERAPGNFKRQVLPCLLFALLSGATATSLWAEGSKDFVGYPGYRMFLDTRDPQQLKVFANAGEFINVGSSHVGIQNGFISIYNPQGALVATFDNTNPNVGLAIIDNNLEELAGPTGGGTTNGPGYVPGVFQASQTGIWTVVFDYPSYSVTPFNNILNNAPWTRAADQPNSRRVVLAWDITITSGAAGNNGGTVHEGRVYSNEHISLLNNNGILTSPIFFVLTSDGYLYQVNINDADPFRFPISSNSLGLVNGNRQPVYLSKDEAEFTRSDNPSSWIPGDIYLYEPQAEDFDGLINNKIFFNLPDTTMPEFAPVTDIFRNNAHTTWLFRDVEPLELDTLYLQGLGCAPGVLEFNQDAYFIFQTNLGGTVNLELDLNNNGIFTDPVDKLLTASISGGLDSVAWDLTDGLGNPIPAQTNFQLRFRGTIQFGELHIALTDVENNPGGVTFQWLNPLPGNPGDLFYYDHSDIGGPVSGGGAPGDPQPTTTPYTYTGNAGNNKYIDQWFFVEFQVDITELTVNIVNNCQCDLSTPALDIIQDGGSFCDGESLTLSVVNTNPDAGNLTYTWVGPSGFFFQETIAPGDTSSISIAVLSENNEGNFSVSAVNAQGCASSPVSLPVTVNPVPQVGAVAGGGDYCAGETVTLSANNLTAGINQITYTWSGPGVNFTNTVPGTEPLSVSIPGVSMANEGAFTLTYSSDAGCAGQTAQASLNIDPTPEISGLGGGGNFCAGASTLLTATSIVPGIPTVNYTWTGPNGFFFTATTDGDGPFSVALTNMDASFEGTYTLTVTTPAGCVGGPVTVGVDINTIPQISAISPNGSLCAGVDLLLTAQNVVPGTGDIIYTWTGPNGFVFTDTASELGPFVAPITNLPGNAGGIYTLVLTTLGGCQSVPQTTEITIAPQPVIANLLPSGDVCLGADVTLSGTNTTPGIPNIFFTWTGPNFFQGGAGDSDGPFEATILDVSPANEGDYILQLNSDQGCLSEPDTVTLSVINGLNVIDVSPDQTICQGDEIVLSASNTVDAGQIIYTWTGPGGFTFTDTTGSTGPFTVIIPNLTAANSGIYMLNLTSEAGCVSQPVEVNVTVTEGVEITNLEGDGIYCEGAELLLSATGTGSADTVIYTWTGPNGFIFTDTTDADGPFTATIDSLTVANSGPYFISITTNNGCTDGPETVSVEVLLTPTIINLTPGGTFCERDTVVLCGQNGTPGIASFDWVWTCPNGQTFSGIGSGDEFICAEYVTLGNWGSGPYTLVLSNSGCSSEPGVVDIQLNLDPVISQISGGGVYCEGDTAFLTFTNLQTGLDSIFFTCNLPGGVQVTSSAGGSDTITVMLTEPGTICCSMDSYDGCNSDLVCTEVTFQANPQISVDSTATICDDEPLTLTGSNTATGSGQVSYTWTGPGGFTFTGTAPWGGPFPVTIPDPQTGDYCLIVSSAVAGCVSEEQCVEVTVNPLPEVQGGAISGGGDEVCAGADVVLSATVVISDGTNISYTWTHNGTAVETGTVASGSTLTLTLDDIAVNEGGTYCLELSSAAGCDAEPVCTTVTVNPTPEIVSVTGGGSFCQGVNVALSGTGTPGLGTVEYMWMGPCNFLFNGTAPSAGPFPATINNIGKDCGGVYTLIVKLNGCESEPQSVVIDVNPMPIITISSGGGTFCAGETTDLVFTIDLNMAQSAQYELNGPGGMVDSGTVTVTTTLTIPVIVSETTEGTYTLEVTSNAGCEAEPASETIELIEVQPPVLTADPNPLCSGESLQLCVEGQPGVTYTWFLGGAPIDTTTDICIVVVDASPGNYSVVASLAGCSSAPDEVVVVAPEPPQANDDEYEGEVNTIVADNVLQNDANLGNGVTVILVSGPDNGTVDINPDNGNFQYQPNPGFSGDDHFTYRICSVDCPELCDEAEVHISFPNVPCLVPNVMTPNGDEVNDLLILDCLINPEQFPNNSLRVFNRWGDEIFVAEPYLNNWEGTYGNDNKPLPAGTYFYMFLEDKNTDDVVTGYITIVR